MKTSLRVILVGLLAFGACSKESIRGKVLESLVEDVEVPAYAALSARCRQLADAAGRLADEPSQATLDAARSRWRDALADWNTTFPFRPSALTQRAPHFRAAYWPPEPKLIQAVLAGDQPVDQKYVDELGVSAKGMYALEGLLYGAPKDGAAPLSALQASGPAGARRRGYARALAADIAKTAAEAAAIVGDRGYASAYAREGQDALNRLVNDGVAVLEGLVVERLMFMVSALDAGTLPAIPYQGRSSATSFVITQAQLRGLAAIYAPKNGDGLSRLVRASSEDADRAVRAALERAVGSVDGLGGPLEDAARRDLQAVKRAADDVRALEVLMKTNVASALGVTLTFTAGDGD